MLFSCLNFGALASKYSKEMNDPKPTDGKSTVEFRINKLNQVWEKALRVSNLTCTSASLGTITSALNPDANLPSKKKRSSPS